MLWLITGFSSISAEEVRFVKEGGVYHLPVIINNAIELKFVVDTGAADVHIPADVALTLTRTGTISKQDFLGTASYQMADGSIKENARFILRSLQIGERIIKNIEASVGPVESSLLLGQSALEKLEPWRMETKRGFFVLGDSNSNHSEQANQGKSIDSQVFDKGVLYFAADLPPTENIPPESPLCYKFQVASPEVQLKMLKKKYPDIFDVKIQKNTDGSKNLVAKRQEDNGNIINYFYSTSPIECNKHQQSLSDNNSIKSPSYSSIPVFNPDDSEGWSLISSNINGNNYYLLSSEIKQDNYVSIWIKTEYHIPKQIGKDGVKIMKFQFLHDCTNKMFKLVNYVSYDSNGNILNTGGYENEKKTWNLIKHNTTGEDIFKLICKD